MLPPSCGLPVPLISSLAMGTKLQGIGDALGRRMRRDAASAVVLGLLAVGCVATQGADPKASPKAAVEQLYAQSLEDLEDGLFPEAIKGFTEIKTKYPYSALAALADLRLADTHFKRGKLVESIDAYRSFLKFHPGHSEAAYAMLRIGDAYLEQVPGDWWFLPPSAEKDQGSTRMAISAYRDMLAKYRGHALAGKARESLQLCRTKLADHELYVANFYHSRRHFRAAATRADLLLEKYSGLGHDEEALWIAGASRFELGESASARAALSRLAEKFSAGSYASKANDLLSRLPATDAMQGHGKPADEASEQESVTHPGGADDGNG